MSTPAPRPPDPRFAPPTPFARLVWTHAASACGDACIAVSLAGSAFFQGPTSGSREKVLLYLLVAIAPFAVVMPILGPALDRTRGGRRLLVVLSMVARALLSFALARFVTKGGAEGLVVYPLVFSILVIQKGYSIAKSSLVPAVVDAEAELVRANSRLALVSTVATPVGGALAALVQWVFGADWSLVLAFLVFVAATSLAIKIPKIGAVERKPEDVQLEREELHQASILLAGSAMAVMRAAVGFVVIFTIFSLRDDVIGLGVAGALGIGGAFVGNLIAPLLRERIREETMLAAAIITSATLAMFGALAGGVFGFALSGLAVAVGAATGKLGFDSLLQRDGPDAVRGRAFARFEARFQLAWVVGALLGIIPLNHQIGLLALGLTIAFAGASYLGALRAARGRVYRTTIRPKVVDELFDKARDELRERRGRTRGGRRKTARARRTAPRPPADDASPPSPPPRRCRSR
jgi:hypothetical protein